MKLLKNLTIVCCLIVVQTSYGMFDYVYNSIKGLWATEISYDRFFDAAENDVILRVEESLNSGINVNKKNEDGWTALMLAAKRDGHEKIVKLLLDHGANVNEKNQWGGTALMVTNNGNIGKLLLDHGATVDEKDNRGWTALMISADKGNPRMVKLLLDHGANVNEKNNEGQTALMLASDTDNNWKSFRLLLEYGATVDEKDNTGKTALIYASERPMTAPMATNLLILFANKETLTSFPQQRRTMLSSIMEAFIDWIEHGAPPTSLDKNAGRFALASFAMPHFIDEFKMTFNFLVKNMVDFDYSKLFNTYPEVIKDALFTRNIKAFEVLIRQAKKDGKNELIKVISTQVSNFNRTKFNSQFLDDVSDLLQGKKIPVMKKRDYNAVFLFK